MGKKTLCVCEHLHLLYVESFSLYLTHMWGAGKTQWAKNGIYILPSVYSSPSVFQCFESYSIPIHTPHVETDFFALTSCGYTSYVHIQSHAHCLHARSNCLRYRVGAWKSAKISWPTIWRGFNRFITRQEDETILQNWGHTASKSETLILNNHICYAASKKNKGHIFIIEGFGMPWQLKMKFLTFQNLPDCCHRVSQIKLVIHIN